MSVTINTTPYTVAPVGKNNPVAFVVTGSNRVATPGVARALSIVKSGTITNGATIVFEWGSYSLTFTFTTSYAVIDTGLALNPAMDAAAIAAALRLNFLINRDFIITVAGSTITFTARATGTAYQLEITLPTGITFGATDVDGVNEVLNSNYKHFAQILVEDTFSSGVYSKKAELFADAGSDQKAVHYFDGILRGLMRDLADVPTFNQTARTTAANILRRYQVEFAEFYGAVPTVQKLYNSGIYYALNGELATDQFPGYDFLDMLSAKKFFLTNRPQKIDTWSDAQQYLYFMNYLTATTNFTMWVRIYYTDNTAATTNYATISALNKYDTVIIPVGFSQLNIASIDPSKTISHYQVWLTPAGSETPASRPMRFFLKQKPYFGRHFIFQNKKGGFDTLLCAYQATLRPIEKEQRRAFVPYNYAKTDGALKSDVKEAYESHTISSIFLRKEEAEAALEIISSPHVYLVGATGFIRVDIEGGEIAATDEASDLFSVEFSYRYSLQASDAFIVPNGNYSNDYSNDFDI